MTLFTFFIVHKQEFIFPALFVGIGTYFIADIFFGVYSMALDTYFLCARKSYEIDFFNDFLQNLKWLNTISVVDSTENDGTTDKPYYMARRLSKQMVPDKSSRKQNEPIYSNTHEIEMDDLRYG